MFSNSVIRQAGKPVSMISRMEPSVKACSSYLNFRVLLVFRMTAKYANAAVLDSAVAMAAPVTSLPAGSRTNMNSGSRMIFRMPPRMIPLLARPERPSARIRWENIVPMAVAGPPMHTVVTRYFTDME